MHELLVNRLGDLSLPRKSVIRLTDRPDMTLDVYRGRKTKIQQQYDDPEWTLIYFSARSNLVPKAFEWETLKTCIFLLLLFSMIRKCSRPQSL